MGRRCAPLAAMALGAAALSACVSAGQVSERPMFSQVAPGRRIVEARCAGCHGVHGTLYGRAAQAPRFMEIRDRYNTADLAERLYAIALHGHGEMPPFVYAPGDVDSLVAYIKSAR